MRRSLTFDFCAATTWTLRPFRDEVENRIAVVVDTVLVLVAVDSAFQSDADIVDGEDLTLYTVRFFVLFFHRLLILFADDCQCCHCSRHTWHSVDGAFVCLHLSRKK